MGRTTQEMQPQASMPSADSAFQTQLASARLESSPVRVLNA